METLEAMAGMLQWAGKNCAYNLDFIPDDKLSWKPAPDANSALEIVQHVGIAMTLLRRGIAGEGSHPDEVSLPASREEAKAQLVAWTNACADAIRALKPEDFGRTLDLNGREFPMQQAAGIPLIDLLHHHGQFAYIQTLLGDTESHFDASAF